MGRLSIYRKAKSVNTGLVHKALHTLLIHYLSYDMWYKDTSLPCDKRVGLKAKAIGLIAHDQTLVGDPRRSVLYRE